MARYVEVRRLAPNNVGLLVDFFSKLVDTGISERYHPHEFDRQTARGLCNYDGMDWFAGCFVCSDGNEQIAGYAMLRGWDKGYRVPSFGVAVASDCQGIGIGRMLLDVAVLTARFNNSPQIRLKVRPDNGRARRLYESSGFTFSGEIDQGELVGYLALLG